MTVTCEYCSTIVLISASMCCSACKYPFINHPEQKKIDKINEEKRVETEKMLLSSTQPLVVPTRRLLEIKSSVKDIHRQISELQLNLHQLEQDKFDYETQLCTLDKTVYLGPCPYTSCRGFVNDSYQCGLCQGYMCTSCKKERHHGTCDAVSFETKPESRYDRFISRFDTNKFIHEHSVVKDRVHVILRFCETVFPRLFDENESTNQDLRIEYLSNYITETDFIKKVHIRHKRAKQKVDYKAIITFYIHSVSALEANDFLNKEREIHTKANQMIELLNKTYPCAFIP